MRLFLPDSFAQMYRSLANFDLPAPLHSQFANSREPEQSILLTILTIWFPCFAGKTIPLEGEIP